MRLPVEQHGGFTLIEVLIAVFVLSFGVISVAALQLTANHIAQQSGYQSAASRLATELADMMRAHPTLFTKADSPFYINYAASKATHNEPVTLCYGGHSCNETQSAQFQLHEWRQRATTMLPNVRVSVCRDSTPYNRQTSQLNWYCNRSQQASIVIKIGWSNKAAPANDTPYSTKEDPPNMAMIVEASQQLSNDDT
jgi:type IV pilus assembly protein PilV